LDPDPKIIIPDPNAPNNLESDQNWIKNPELETK